MKQHKLIYPYRKVLREVVTYDYDIFTKEKAMLEIAGYKLAYQHCEEKGGIEYYTYVYVQL